MYIYVVLSYTGSIPSKLIKKATQNNYTHVSISDSPSLSTMYSFGRKYVCSPYPGGFIKENINGGLYKLKKSTEIAVYRLPVSIDTLELLYHIIDTFYNGDYFYDFKGAIGVYMQRNMFRKNGYVCSSFVNKVLNDIGVNTNKKDWEIRPQEFSNVIGAELIYEGYALDYTGPTKIANQSATI